MHGPTCVFWANLTPSSPQSASWEGLDWDADQRGRDWDDADCAFPSAVTDRVCAACGAGTFQPYSHQRACPPCAPQTYDDDADPVTRCKPCGAGSVVTPNRSACVLVDPCRAEPAPCHAAATCAVTVVMGH